MSLLLKKISNRVRSLSPYRKDLLNKALSEIFIAFVGIWTFAIFASNLSKAEFAATNHSIALIALIGPIILLRVNTAFSVFLPGNENKDELKSVFLTTLIVNTVVAFAFLLLLNLKKRTVSYLLLGDESFFAVISLVSIFYFFNILNTLINEFFRATNNIQISSLFGVINALSKVLVLITILNISKKFDIINAVLIYCLSEIIVILFGLSFFLHKYKNYSFTFNFCVLKEYYKYSLPLVPYSIFAWMNTSIAKIMLNHMVGLDLSASYTFNHSLVSRIFLINTVIAYTTFPHMSKLWNKGETEKITLLLKNALNIGFFFGFPITLGLITVLPTIADLFSSGKYEADVFIVCLFCISMLFAMIYSVLSYLIDMSRKTLWYTIILFISSLAGILCNLILIPLYSIRGAAFAFLFTNLIQMILVWFVGHRVTKVKICFDKFFIAVSFSLSLIMYWITNLIYTNSGLMNFFLTIMVGIIFYFSGHFFIYKKRKVEC